MQSHSATLEQLALWRGHDVVAADGGRLGKLEGIVYEYESRQPVWLVVGEGLFGFRKVLAPVAGAESDGDHLHLAYPRQILESEPEVDIGAGYDDRIALQRLYEYFNLGRPGDVDLRVVHTHEELPGSEDNRQ